LATITYTAAFTLLGPYLPVVRNCVEGGWDDYRTLYDAHLRAIHDSTTRANIVNNHITQRLRQVAVPGSGMMVIDQNHLSLLSVASGSALIRMKKLNMGAISRTYPTKQARRFARQLPLDGIPEVPRFDAGYVLDSLETTIIRIFVAQPKCLGSVSWKIDVLEATGGTADGSATVLHFMQTGPSKPSEVVANSPLKIKPGTNPKTVEKGSLGDSETE
jgi:hypothetical protein